MSPSLAASAAFVAIVATLLAMLALALRRAEGGGRRVALGVGLVLGWLALTAVMAASGFLRDFDARPPRLLLLVGPAVLACVVVTLLPLGGRLARLPAAWLVGFQAFRIVMELVLHRLHVEGVLPERMTFEGRNLDILTGLAAIPVAWLAARGRMPRWGLAVFNLAGLALLVNIVTIAILSTPYSFRRFTDGPANEVIFGWPFCWLPGFVVPMALIGHLVSFRQILQRPDPR